MIRKFVVMVGALMTVGAVLALGAPSAQAQYNPDDPGAAVSDATVARGDSVTVYATGCPAGVPVSFYLDGAPVASATTQVDGVASATFVVDVPAGRHSVTNSCNNVSLTLVVAEGAAADGPPLSRTGSDTTLLLVRISAMALTIGGLLLLASRRRALRS